MIKIYGNDNRGRVALMLLLIFGIIGILAMPANAGRTCDEICDSPLLNEVHTMPDGMDPESAPPPIVGFCVCPRSGCDSLFVEFNDWSKGYIDTWEWDFGDPASGSNNYSNEEYPSHMYRNPGNYNITLTVTGPGGTSSMTEYDWVVVRTNPTADFTFSSQTGCLPATINFYDKSTYANYWRWDFGDGSSSGEQNPTHTYTAAGTYLVTLKVMNGCGIDYITKEVVITADNMPIADFTSDNTNGCNEATINFTDQSKYADTWLWDFGDGTTSPDQNPTHTYSTIGSYNVSLKVTNECGEDTEIKTQFITILPPPVADFSTDMTETCAGAEISFTDLSVGAETWLWDFGDGDTSTDENPVHNYPGEGAYTVTLTVTGECGSDAETKISYITILKKPVADFSASSTKICAGQDILFTDLSTGANSRTWDFGDGTQSFEQNPSHIYYDTGWFSITLIAENECGDDTEYRERYIYVKPWPLANFTTASEGNCIPLEVSFSNLSENADSYYWEFGDGMTSIDEHPNHTFTTAGEYYVRLTATNICGSDDKVSEKLVVIDKLIADFITYNPEGCIGMSIGFEDRSTNATSWKWEFGDGATSTSQNPSHTYSSSGLFTVTLTVTNSCGSDTEERINYILIHPSPIADFTADKTEICAGATISFTDNSTYAESWDWNFGDGGSSSAQNPTHTYVTPGRYTVSLTVKNSCGPDTEYRTDYIYVLDNPIADFNTEDTHFCTNTQIEFFDDSQYAQSWNWDFGDGSTSIVQNPTHIYATPGIYTVSLKVTNICGEDTKTKVEYVTIDLGPIADFTGDKSGDCDQTTISFTNLSAHADSYEWDFGDGTPASSAVNPSHSYSVSGTYTVTLTAYNDCGENNKTQEYDIIIYDYPIADFEMEIRRTCTDTEIGFIDMSQNAIAWLWDFGDGVTSAMQNPSHIYTIGGKYDISLTVVNDCGEDTEIKTEYVTITPPPVAEFFVEVDEVCVGETVYFGNNSTDAYSYLWNFGDGATSHEINPNHSYSVAGAYTISLTTFNLCGEDTETKTNYVTVTAGPTADFNATPVSGNAPLAVTFSDLSTSDLGIDSWEWNFGDGETSDVQSPVHIYNIPGIYTISLIVTDDCGKDTATRVEYIEVIDKCIVDFNAEPNLGCAGFTVYFGASTNGPCEISSYNWDFGDTENNTATGQNVEHIYSASGTYTVTLTAEDANGAIIVIKTDFITVYIAPTASFTASPTSGSAPLPVSFTDNSTNGGTRIAWRWNFGDPASGSDNESLLQNPTHIYSTNGNYTVSLIVSNECGIDTTTSDISVAPIITIVKEADKAFARVNDELIYTLRVQNNTSELSGSILVVDTIPDFSSYINGSANNNGFYDPSVEVVTWALPFVAPQSEEELTFRVVLDGPFSAYPATVSNQALAYLSDDASKSAYARIFYSNMVVTEVDITTGGDLTLNKQVSATLASPGDLLTYTLSVENESSSESASNVVVYDAIPDSTTYVPGSISGGGIFSLSNDSLEWNLGSMNPFETRTVTFQVTIDTDAANNQEILNTALVQSSMGSFESNKVITTISVTPLVITKTTSTPSGMVGDLLRFTITINNYSGDIFTDVHLIDTMPGGTFYVDGTALVNGVNIEPIGVNPYDWALGDIPPSGTLTIEYTGLIGASANPGLNENVARANALQNGSRLNSNRATARIFILSHTLTGSIRGKLIIDCDNIAGFDKAPSGVDIYLDDGSHSRVNEEGMFYFSSVRAGERVVALDERDLEGYYIPEGSQASVFVHVHETGESYVIFRICPDYARLDIRKEASIIPKVKATKTAKVSSEQSPDSLGILVDYVIDIKSNGLADPTDIRIVDSFPESMRFILDESQVLQPKQNGNHLVYEISAAQERLQKSVMYSLKDMEPGQKQFLTNKVYIEGDIVNEDEESEVIVSEPLEVSVGPLLLAPPQDVQIALTPALFITSKALLQPPAIPQLEAIADSILRYKDADIKIEGHCDYRQINTDEFPSNWELGEARAKAVVDWLVENRDIERDRLAYKSFAATRPVVMTGKTSEELQPNRRTEVIIRAAVPGFLVPTDIPAEGWASSTSLVLNPVRFDTLFENVQTPIHIGIDDSWEVVLTIENTSSIAAENSVVTDILPDGVEYIANSAVINGESVEATAGDGKLTVSIKRIEPSQKIKLSYRVEAQQGQTPAGGGAASVELTTSHDILIIQKSNEVRFE